MINCIFKENNKILKRSPISLINCQRLNTLRAHRGSHWPPPLKTNFSCDYIFFWQIKYFLFFSKVGLVFFFFSQMEHLEYFTFPLIKEFYLQSLSVIKVSFSSSLFWPHIKNPNIVKYCSPSWLQYFVAGFPSSSCCERAHSPELSEAAVTELVTKLPPQRK